jgi:hypothetical protein
MLKVVIGVACGVAIAGAFLAFGPNGMETKARAAGKVAIEKVDEARFDYCQKQFLEETSCFQKLPNAQCVDLIQQKCGSQKECTGDKCPATVK